MDNIKFGGYFIVNANKDYKQNYFIPSKIGYTNIKVLEFLYGRELDDIAYAYIHGLRPASVRICRNGRNCDCQRWRVNVEVDENNKIISIDQEIEVALPKEIDNGHLLNIALNKNP